MENKDNNKNEQSIQAGYYLIKVLKSVLDGNTPEKMPVDVTVKRLSQLAKRHNLDHMAYVGVCQIPGIQMDEELLKWQKRSMQCAMQGIVQMSERDKLYQFLTEAGVRILPLKGCLIKEMYPKQEYRQMSDLDVLIDDSSAEKVRDLMEKNGYVTDDFGNCYHDGYIKKPWTRVEIHRNMLPKEVDNAKKYRNIWDYAYEETPGCRRYRLNWDEFYIYMLEHFAKHFREGGSGIRSVMDMHIFLQEKGAELHEEYLEKRLKKLKLWDFKNRMEQIADDWFEKGITGNHVKLEEMIILSGAYGAKELRYILRTEYFKEKYHFAWMAKLRYMGEMVFLNYDGMCILYPILERVPILLPILWVHRIMKVICTRQRKVKRIFEKMKKDDKNRRK